MNLQEVIKKKGFKEMKNYVTVGVYPNDSYKVNVVLPGHLEGHVEYNAKLRPGRLLFVDGKYACGGCYKKEYLSKIVEKWEKKISEMNINSNVPSVEYV